MCAIGLKGGALVAQNGFTQDLFAASAAGLILSYLIPVAAFIVLRSFGSLHNRITAHNNLMHRIPFEIVTELSFTHDSLLASLLGKKVSTILGASNKI